MCGEGGNCDAGGGAGEAPGEPLVVGEAEGVPVPVPVALLVADGSTRMTGGAVMAVMRLSAES